MHMTPPVVKPLPFWPKGPCYWFTLADSTFNCNGIVNSRLCFDLVLPALLEEVIRADPQGAAHG